MSSFKVLSDDFVPPQKIRIAIANDVAPYQYVDKGQVSGYVPDVWKLWSERNNVQIEFVPSIFWDTEENVLSGEADVHAALADRETRAGMFDYGHEIYATPITVYLHKDIKYVPTVAELTPYKVGVIVGNKHEEALANLNPNISFVRFDDWLTMIQALYRGDIKAFVSYDFVAFKYYGYQEVNDLLPKYNRIKIGEVKPQVAVAKGNTALLNFIDEGFKKLTPEDFKSLDKKWISTDENKDVLSISYAVGAEPFMGIESDGQASGLFVDLWRLWAEKTNTTIEFVAHSPGSSLDSVREGVNELHIGYPESMTFNSGMPRAHHLYTSKANLFVYGEYDFAEKISQIHGQKIGIFKDAPYQDQLMFDLPNIELVYFSSLDNAINAAIQGQIKGFVTTTQLAKRQLENNNISHRFFKIPEIEYETRFYSLVNENNKHLLKTVQEGFRLITQQEFIKIENRWIPETESRFFSAQKSQFKLSHQHKEWLAKNPEMTVAIVKDWTPYEFIDEKGEAAGISRDMFDIASKLTGQKYNFKAYPTWEELYSDFKGGKVDIVANITASDERRAFANFTSAYWRTPWSVITHKSADSISSIKKFYGKRVAIIQGYQIIKEIHDKHPQVIIHVVKDFDEAQELLRAGVIDGILDLMNVSAQYIQDHSLYQYRIHTIDDLPSDNAHIGVKKDLVDQARIMELVVRSLSERDVEAILKKWNTVDVVAGIKEEVYWRNITFAVGGSVFVVVLVLLWNRKLKKEIELRKTAEKKLQHMASHDPLTGLPNRSLLMDRISQAISHHARNNKSAALLFLDLDGFKQVNDTFGHDVGDELLMQVSERLSQVIRNSDTVARFGGDEFVVLATNLTEGTQAATLAEKIIIELSKPFVLSVETVSIGVSIGISCFPEHGMGGIHLIKAADDAMYKVKANGKNSYEFAA